MTSDEHATPALLMGKPTWLITQLSAQAHRLLGSHLATVGARGYHFRLLAALAESGPASQASLGRRTEMDRSDVTAAVGELAADGLVERTTDAGDRRRNVVTITDAGRARLRRLDEVLNDVQDELLAPLSSDERATLVGLLERLTRSQASGTLRSTARTTWHRPLARQRYAPTHATAGLSTTGTAPFRAGNCPGMRSSTDSSA